jgi:hypothetical protein
LDYGWSDGDEDQRGHDKQNEGDDHLDGSFGSLFFGSLAALGT